MNISILTLFPELYKPFIDTSLIKRAEQEGVVAFDIQSLFAFCGPKERIDGHTFGHSAGMVLKPDIIEKAIETQEQAHGKAYKIFFSPHGKKLDQHAALALANTISQENHVMLLPARYEGMDARIEEEYADEIISIGDYVLLGGDVPAMVLLEAVLRLLPGVVGKQESIERESFSGPFVDYPEYTAPVEWKGRSVPEVLRSGNHKAIADWRENEAARRTTLHHFDWLRAHRLSERQKKQAWQFMPSHYAATMHSGVVVQDDRVGTTSVTSFDIHDIARSARTYGLKNYFIVTPLEDQQRVVGKLIDFWKTGPGLNYNMHRVEAIGRVHLQTTLDEVLDKIRQQEGKEPLIIGTGARPGLHQEMISYHDQEKVWGHGRPVLFLFGTGRGLARELLDKCHFMLEPVYGFTDFNHLSVRSAAAIIFDRWMGINPEYLKEGAQ